MLICLQLKIQYKGNRLAEYGIYCVWAHRSATKTDSQPRFPIKIFYSFMDLFVAPAEQHKYTGSTGPHCCHDWKSLLMLLFFFSITPSLSEVTLIHSFCRAAVAVCMSHVGATQLEFCFRYSDSKKASKHTLIWSQINRPGFHTHIYQTPVHRIKIKILLWCFISVIYYFLTCTTCIYVLSSCFCSVSCFACLPSFLLFLKKYILSLFCLFSWPSSHPAAPQPSSSNAKCFYSFLFSYTNFIPSFLPLIGFFLPTEIQRSPISSIIPPVFPSSHGHNTSHISLFSVFFPSFWSSCLAFFLS